MRKVEIHTVENFFPFQNLDKTKSGVKIVLVDIHPDQNFQYIFYLFQLPNNSVKGLFAIVQFSSPVMNLGRTVQRNLGAGDTDRRQTGRHRPVEQVSVGNDCRRMQGGIIFRRQRLESPMNFLYYRNG